MHKIKCTMHAMNSNCVVHMYIGIYLSFESQSINSFRICSLPLHLHRAPLQRNYHLSVGNGSERSERS